MSGIILLYRLSKGRRIVGRHRKLEQSALVKLSWKGKILVKKLLLTLCLCVMCVISVIGSCSAASERDIQLMSGWNYNYVSSHSFFVETWEYNVRSENPHELGYESDDPNVSLPTLWCGLRGLDEPMETIMAFTYDSASDVFTVYSRSDDKYHIAQKVRFLSDEQIEITAQREDNNIALGEKLILYKLHEDGSGDGYYTANGVKTSKGAYIWMQRYESDFLVKFLQAVRTGIR